MLKHVAGKLFVAHESQMPIMLNFNIQFFFTWVLSSSFINVVGNAENK